MMKWTRQNRDIEMETCTVANGTRCMICMERQTIHKLIRMDCLVLYD